MSRHAPEIVSTPDGRRRLSAKLCAPTAARQVAPGGALAVWPYPHPRLERVCAWLGQLTVIETRLRERGVAVRRLLASGIAPPGRQGHGKS